MSFLGLPEVRLLLSAGEEPGTGPSAPGVASPVLSRGAGSPPSSCWLLLTLDPQGLLHQAASQLGVHSMSLGWAGLGTHNLLNLAIESVFNLLHRPLI